MDAIKSHLSGLAHTTWVSRLVFWLTIAGMAYGLYKAYDLGQTMRAAAQARAEEAIASEDRAFCEKFGMSVGSATYLSCCRELSFIRQKQTERDRTVTIDML
jgi:hypothetical protein